jgi:hypothetical protein
LITAYARPNLFYNTYWFVSDYEARSDRVLASNDVKISPANRRQRDSNDRFTHSRLRAADLLDTKLALTVEYVRKHLFH